MPFCVSADSVASARMMSVLAFVVTKQLAHHAAANLQFVVVVNSFYIGHNWSANKAFSTPYIYTVYSSVDVAGLCTN